MATTATQYMYGDNGAPMTYLQQINPLPAFDNHVRLEASTHTYYVDGQPLARSMTGCISESCGKFDAQTKAAEILERCRDFERNPTQQLAQWRLIQIERYKNFADVQAVVDYWAANALVGIALHRLIERFENANLLAAAPAPPIEYPLAFQHFLRFQREFVQQNNLVPFRTELSMTLYGIGGQADMLYKAPDGTLWLIDWKHKYDLWAPISRRIPAMPPFEAYDVCDSTKFTIQLNGYREMFHARAPPTLRISRMFVVLLHEWNPSYAWVEIQPIPQLMALMFAPYRKQHIRTCIAMARDELTMRGLHPDPQIARESRNRVRALLDECDRLEAASSEY